MRADISHSIKLLPDANTKIWCKISIHNTLVTFIFWHLRHSIAIPISSRKKQQKFLFSTLNFFHSFFSDKKQIFLIHWFFAILKAILANVFKCIWWHVLESTKSFSSLQKSAVYNFFSFSLCKFSARYRFTSFHFPIRIWNEK